jgi:crossover junction endodeoxyribonuclease RuvC
MVILGLDPGLARTGFGVIDTNHSQLFIRCGCLTTLPGLSVADRLAEIAADLKSLLVSVRPELAVVEQIFFGANRKTALLTAEVRGVILYLLKTHHVAIKELTPLQIKSQLTGHGTASKEQIQAVVAARLSLNSLPQPDDAADALAAALCGYHFATL